MLDGGAAVNCGVGWLGTNDGNDHLVRGLLDGTELELEGKPVEGGGVMPQLGTSGGRRADALEPGPSGHRGKASVHDILVRDMLGEDEHISVLHVGAPQELEHTDEGTHEDVVEDGVVDSTVDVAPLLG